MSFRYLLISILLSYICIGYEMNIFMLPHVLSSWKEDQFKAWDDWRNTLQLFSIYLKNQQITITVPTFYMNLIVDSNGTKFNELMKDYNLVFIVPNNNATIIERMSSPFLSKEVDKPKKFIGIQFHNVEGFGFGDTEQEHLSQLNEMDLKFRNEYKDYGGIDILDYEFFKRYYLKHQQITFPQIRTIYFNYFNLYNASELNYAINLCKQFNSSLSLDISEIESEYFMECASFIELLKTITNEGVEYKLLLNRSMWLKEWFVFLNFFHNKCLDQIKKCKIY